MYKVYNTREIEDDPHELQMAFNDGYKPVPELTEMVNHLILPLYNLIILAKEYNHVNKK